MPCSQTTCSADGLRLDATAIGGSYVPGRPVFALICRDETEAELWSGAAWVAVSDQAKNDGAIPLPECPPGSRRYGPVPIPAHVPAGEWVATYWQRPAGRLPDDGYPLGVRGVVTATGSEPPTPTPHLGCLIAEAASNPASVTMADGRSANAHRLPDLIAADRYLAGKAALAPAGGGTRSPSSPPPTSSPRGPSDGRRRLPPADGRSHGR